MTTGTMSPVASTSCATTKQSFLCSSSATGLSIAMTHQMKIEAVRALAQKYNAKMAPNGPDTRHVMDTLTVSVSYFMHI